MAYVYRESRSPGKPWYIAYKGVSGTLRREKTDAPTKELAQKFLARRLVEVTESKVAGITIEAKPITFSQFLPEYRSYIEAHKTPQACRRDETSIKHLEATFGAIRLRDINTGMVQRFVDIRMHAKNRYGKPLKPATANRDLTSMQAILREALKRGYVDRNVAHGVKQMREENQIVRYLSDDEETALLKECNPTLRNIVIVALHSGLRRGEILNLQWADVDFEQRIIRVRFTKSKKTRYVPMNLTLTATMHSLPRVKGSPYVFANPDTLDRCQDITNAWEGALRRAGVTGFRFHDLRHTFASRMVQMGVQMKAIQELLGHGSIELTMRYAHLAPGDLRRAVDFLDRKSTRLIRSESGSGDAKKAAGATDCETA